MGQVTFGLMWGSKMPQDDSVRWYGESVQEGKKWVYKNGLLELYKPVHGMKPEKDEQFEIVGFFVAVGASGRDDCPDLEGPIDCLGVDADPRYADALEKARAEWEPFTAFCTKHGVTLDPPRMWLVETEVG